MYYPTVLDHPIASSSCAIVVLVRNGYSSKESVLDLMKSGCDAARAIDRMLRYYERSPALAETV